VDWSGEEAPEIVAYFQASLNGAMDLDENKEL